MYLKTSTGEQHLSASSISLFLRCPRQFQEVYIRGGERGPVGSALVIGSAVHLGLSRLLKGEELGNYFDDALKEQPLVIWKDTESASRKWADKMLLNYYHKVGRHLNVLDTEVEMLLDIPGVDIPILGYVDIKTDRGIVDVKTTSYVSRKPELQKSWKLQMNIYQLEHPQPGEFHVLTRNSSNSVIVPDSRDHPFYCPLPKADLRMFIRQTYGIMKHLYGVYGEEINWPCNLTHEWAAKYCVLGGECCQQ